MPVIFGYGSLISRSSAEKTLGRSLCSNDIQYATIRNHLRSWTAQGDVKLLLNQRPRPCDALFLDLTESAGNHCNGVAIRVSQRELLQLDIRECCYDRCEVELDVAEGVLNKAYAYRVPENEKEYYGITLAAYRKIIDEALLEFPPEFVQQFWHTTLPSAALMVEGEYIFEDCAQMQPRGSAFLSYERIIALIDFEP